MLIPFGIDKPLRRRPIITESLIVMNLAVYLLGLMGSTFAWFSLEAFTNVLGFATQRGQSVGDILLHPIESQAWGLLTYQFMHDPNGLGHIIFNMLFLWVFGRAVESRFRHGGFLAFYLMSGVLAGLAHSMVTKEPSLLIGASGSIAGVTGAFLALFPRARVRVLFFFFLIAVIEVPAMLLLALFFALDLARQTMSLLGSTESSVAYMAHIAGYVFGFALSMLLLAFNVLKREEFDMWYILVQSRRRARFRKAQKESRGAIWDARAARQLSSRSADEPAGSEALSAEEVQQAAIRADLGKLIEQHDLEEAARRYASALQQFPKLVLPQRHQLDLASQLYAMGDVEQAAAAYELFLDRYGRGPDAGEVRLLLGVLYARQLRRPSRALELIEAARTQLRDASQIALADEIEAEIQAG